VIADQVTINAGKAEDHHGHITAGRHVSKM
jgi:hypothetical protein